MLTCFNSKVLAGTGTSPNLMHSANGPDSGGAEEGGLALSVLVVDDEAMLAEELADGLREDGFRVTTAHSAAEALALLKADPGIGVLVSDIRMPGGSGLTLASEVLVAEPDATARGVVLITAHGSMETAVEALRAGVSDFLIKPFTLPDAARAVRSSMQRALARRAAATERDATGLRLRDAEAERETLAGRLSEALARLDAARGALPPAAGETEARIRLLAHELRTPLVPVLGFAELLASGHARTPEAAQDYGHHLREAGERLLETVDKLLLWERLQSTAAPARETTDVHALLTEAVARTRRLAAVQDVQVSFGPLQDQTLAVEAASLTAALAGLLDNAIRATPARGTVEIGAELAEGWLRLVVRDRGHGMPDTLLAEAGRPFTVDGPMLSRRREGLGLGLAIARRVAERHGGRLAIGRRPGGGMEAAIELSAA